MENKSISKKTITALDVAKLAGVSQSTVSRVFNKACTTKTSPASRQKVLDAAKALGYIPNALAQAVVSGRSGIIGIVVSDYFNLFYYHVLQILIGMLSRQGMQAMVFTSSPQSNINELLESLYQYQVDGVILTSSALCYQSSARWTQRELPAILLNGYEPDLEISAVQSDHYGSGRIMASYLTSVGHTRFAYINTENSAHKNYLPRQTGFIEGLQEHGITDCRIIPAEYSYRSGLEVGRALLSGNNTPDAIFCSGDLNAFGIIDAVRERNDLKLGVDISVTGYDAPVLSELNAYSLTAMTQQTSRICQDCVDLLIRLIGSPSKSPQIITRPMMLQVRSSSRPVNFQNSEGVLTKQE